MKTQVPAIMLIAVCWIVTTQAQTDGYRTGKIVPPSPTAASLGKYGDIPVSFFNGQPSIQIPLYEIKTANHSLPITIRYDASGTKVKQDASWVGLHWTLAAGGAVTRVIRQKDDMDQSRWGYFYAPSLPPSSNHDYAETGNWQTDKSFFNNIYDGFYDAEPDIFSYNFSGYSGRFMIGKRADGAPVFLDEKNNMQIIYQNNGWLFIDAEGYKYYLSTKETAENYFASSQYEITTFNGLNYLSPDGNGNPASAWYLDSIVAPSDETLAFTYVKGKSLSLMNLSEQFYKLYGFDNTSCEGYGGDALAWEYRSYDYSRQNITDVYLSRIEFTNGSVEFKVSNRLDIDIWNSEGYLSPSKLDSIVIKNGKGDRLRSFAFNYSYFNAANTEGRLKLDAIVEAGSDGETKPPYQFTYRNPNALPSKYSKSVDHWGYRNTANNKTLLPSTIISESISSFSGGNRDADETNLYPADGVLSKIIYPTGGSTAFEYELHDYSNLYGEQSYKTVKKSAVGYTNPTLYPSESAKNIYFTIPPYPEQTQVPVTIICTYQKTDPNSYSNEISGLGFGSLYLVNANGSQTSKYSCVTNQFDGMNTVSYQTTFNLPPGNYHIEMLSWQGWTYTMTVTWTQKEATPLLMRKGGGIRIKSITSVDNLGKKAIKKYIYTGDDGRSSGVLFSAPKYDNRFTVVGNDFRYYKNQNGSNVREICNFIGDYYTIMSSSIFPTGLISSSGIVGYKKVTELDGENGENGKTVYYFKCFEEAPDEFPDVPAAANPQNGKADSVLVYETSGKLLKKTSYTYAWKESSFLKGVKLFTVKTVYSAPDPLDNRVYRIRYYENGSHWFVPDQEIETLYTPSGNIVTTKQYQYSNNKHRQPTQVNLVQSDGKTIVTKFKRPDDYSASGGNSFAEEMKNVHVIAPVIEQQGFLKQGTALKLISGTYAAFNKVNNLFFKPGIVYSADLSAPSTDLSESSFSGAGQPLLHPSYQPDLTFNRYDAHGNILEQQKAGDAKEVYLWGYGAQYPVAKITGSDYATVSALVNQTLLDDPATTDQQMRDELNKIRTGLWATQALVTTYTYKPLVGMTSQTDASGKTIYYEYDGFQRLIFIRDQDGNMLKRICYNYQGQPDNCTAYYNAAKSGTFTPACSAGYTAGAVTYTVAAGTYSATSQTAADQKAQDDINANGQVYANNNGTCKQTWYNVEKSGSYTRNNCGSSTTPTAVTYIVAAGSYSSLVSQADADQKAQNDVNANGQAYANNNGICKQTWYNVEKSGSYTRNNCGSGTTPTAVTYTVGAGSYSSLVSQADADQKAQDDVNNNGQAYANANGTCKQTWYNVEKSGSYTRNNCGSGTTPTTVTYTVAAGSYSSFISQADADQKAQDDVNANGQNYANNNAICQQTWYNTEKSGSYTRNNCGSGTTPTTVTYTVAAGSYSSLVSQADADQKAQDDVNTNGQNYANNNAICQPTWYNVAKSKSFTRNNCSYPYTRGNVSYTVAAGTYSSLISQADADGKAQNDINTNGQAYANSKGTCDCTGKGTKLVKGKCQMGTKVYTSSQYKNGAYQCKYYYQWSDGSTSGEYLETNSKPCPIQ